MKVYKFLLLIALLALSATNTWSAQDENAAILMIGQGLAKQFHTGETGSMLSFYTTDAIMLPPSSEILSTPDDILVDRIKKPE